MNGGALELRGAFLAVAASRPKDVDDVEAIFAARRAAGDVLDWSFLDHWAEEWGIADRLAPYRAGFGPGTS